MSNFHTLVDAIIKSEMNGLPMHEQVLEIGKTPSILIDEAGFPDIDLAVNAKVISKMCFDHGLPTSMLKRLPEIINDPKSLFLSANPHQTDSVVVMTFEVKGSYPIIIPIQKNRKVGRNKIYNLVTSGYAKEGNNPDKKWRDKGLLIWEKPLTST